MKTVWACFDRTDFAIFGIVFVFYSVPVYFNSAGGSKNLPGISTSKSPSYTRSALDSTCQSVNHEFVIYVYCVADKCA